MKEPTIRQPSIADDPEKRELIRSWLQFGNLEEDIPGTTVPAKVL